MHFTGKLKEELKVQEERLSEVMSTKENLQMSLNSAVSEKESLLEEKGEFHSRIKQLQDEKDDEKKNRINFEMRLVEFEDYKKHAENDIVSFLNMVRLHFYNSF